ncbi:fluoride efflux transporter CrcB [Ruficoccus sp. ZRK36]|uniref:fluoride efflux transporter CrcB n=1 Tax=Ruficoccus sp. ZRK36 TaxID=2866311 RepID=UPI002107046B|nr:fluoride efflux transporter CrcB [Ruficoccus sp. ZRK36]
MHLICIALGGALGAVSRAVVSLWIPAEYPWATLVVNVFGSLLIGFIFGLEAFHHINPHLRLLLTTGFCGALTTFSTFSYQTMALFSKGEIAGALANIALNLVLTLLAVAAGLKLAGLTARV